jgi:cytochrome P450
MPTLELVLRETLRLIVTGTALRRNVVDDIPLYNKIVRKGAFMAYPLSDVHLNPDVYTDPYTFNPERWEEREGEDKEKKHGPFTFLGWGAGRHPCLGMKTAKLEIKMIVTLIIAGFEYKLVDKSGNSPVQFPQPDRNDIQQVCRLFYSFYLLVIDMGEGSTVGRTVFLGL